MDMHQKFDTTEAALEHYRDLARTLQEDLDDTKLALDEFRASAGELEKELEKELAMADQELNRVRGREETLRGEVDSWKTKYQSSLREHTKTMMHMQAELDGLRKSCEDYRTRIRDMELDNDDLESKERMVSSSLQDVEAKFGKAIERVTLLEEELIEKSKLEEECQRLRDDLREMSEEVAVLRDQVTNTNTYRPLSPCGTLSHMTPNPPTQTLTSAAEALSPPPTSFDHLPRDVDLTPRKRAVSTTSSPAGLTKPSRSVSMFQNGLVSRKLARSPSQTMPPPARIASPTMTRIPTPTGTISPTPAPAVRPGHRRDLSAVANGRGGPPPRNAHLATLQEETRRMRGLTQKIVSTRNLREVSAIPVPKFGSSNPGQSSSKDARAPLSLGKSTLGKSMVVRRPPPGQDDDSASARGKPRRSLASPAGGGGARTARPPSSASRESSEAIQDVASRSPTPPGPMLFRSVARNAHPPVASGIPLPGTLSSASLGGIGASGLPVPNFSRPTSSIGTNGGLRRKSMGPGTKATNGSGLGKSVGMGKTRAKEELGKSIRPTRMRSPTAA